MKGSLAAAIALALLGGCSFAPPTERPEMKIPAAYKEAPTPIDGQWKEAAPADGASRGAWWEVFADPALSALVVEAAAANQDLAGAAARVEQSRTLVRSTEAARLPRLDFGASAGGGKPENVGPGARAGTDLPPFERYRVGFSASYELDLFGRVRDSVKAAQADEATQQALYESLLLSLQADVARSYFLVRQLDAELDVVDAALRTREESLALVRHKLAAGAASGFDVVRAEGELEAARTERLALERARAQVEHALAVLLGRTPADFSLAKAPLPAAPPAVPVGLPSALLERRPDIAAAERQLAAANARIGVAKSAFYPLFNLTADAGLASGDLGQLFTWSARTWALGPLAGALMTLPLFDGGRNQANLDRAQAALAEDTARYRETVLRAMGEVEDALVGLRTLTAQSGTAAKTREAAATALGLATTRFDAGAASYLDVLDAERQKLQVERLERQIAADRHLTTVGLIRALGGGW